jgi:hypothetical protein
MDEAETRSEAAPPRAPALRRAVFRLALRRQLTVVIVWSLAATFSWAFVEVAVVPLVFAWSERGYRAVAGLLALLLTWVAVATTTGVNLPSNAHHEPQLVIPALVAWATVAPIRRTRLNRLTDLWTYAGSLRDTRESASDH